MNLTQFEQTIINEGDVLFEEEIKLLSQRFLTISIENPFGSKDGYNQIWDLIDKVGLPSVISIINLWSFNIPHVPQTQQDVKRSFAINTYSLVYLVHSFEDAAVRTLKISNEKDQNQPLLSSNIQTWTITNGVWGGVQNEGENGENRILAQNEVCLGQATVWRLNRYILY
ncbi:MAG: hypothetical protein EZS28_021714 [Streblomastix strix]|uniref:Uncharacterized protein n=1 Tax=Streblomastix strix TaxID=222440 RepID=A0A5J4VK97_9EUKA|nr:MAG: hypothetical protein EZS28_021714 [Streblomastix strix]